MSEQSHYGKLEQFAWEVYAAAGALAAGTGFVFIIGDPETTQLGWPTLLTGIALHWISDSPTNYPSHRQWG